MAEVSLVGLFRACVESFRIVATAKHFGEEYELLCTELSILQLRFLLWGQQLSLEPACPNVALNCVLDQPEIKPTIIRTLESISYLLEETCKLKQDYSSGSWTSAKDTIRRLSEVHQDAQTSTQTPGNLRKSVSRLRLRLSTNQKQIPMFQNARWTILDARTFSTKILRLRGYIDGLEKITQAITTTINAKPGPLNLSSTAVAVRGESPPPYAARRASSRRGNSPGASIQNEPPLPRLPNDNADEEQLPPYVSARRFRPPNTITPIQVNNSSAPPAYTARTQRIPTAPSSEAQNSLPLSSSTAATQEQNRPAVEIFRSFRVSMEDPCSKILQAALRKYNIDAHPSTYALYIVYGNEERCVTANEKPLILFKQLDREGKNPSFCLRKCLPPSPSFTWPVSNPSPTPPTAIIDPPPPPPELALSLPSPPPTPSPRNSAFPNTEDLITTSALSYIWAIIGGVGAYRYEISASYKYNVQGTILRTGADFFSLHQAVKQEFAVWDHRLPRLPRHLTRRTNFLTEVDQEAFRDYFTALMGIGDGIHLSEPFRNFFTPRLGDLTHVNYPSDAE